MNIPRAAILLAVLAIFFADVGDSQIMDHSEKMPRKTSLLVSWMGHSSKIQETQFLRITKDADWEALWKRHSAVSTDTPYINFTDTMVVAVFLPEVPFGYGVFISPPVENEKQITIAYGIYGYPANKKVLTAKGTIYGMFVIPRSSKRLVIQPFQANENKTKTNSAKFSELKN
ncbi:MAG: hypothetical protein ACKV19_29915 [Verrucomicrobiales bacterium]